MLDDCTIREFTHWNQPLIITGESQAPGKLGLLTLQHSVVLPCLSRPDADFEIVSTTADFSGRVMWERASTNTARECSFLLVTLIDQRNFNHFPSSECATLQKRSAWNRACRRFSATVVSQTRTVLSQAANSNRLASSLKATSSTQSDWPPSNARFREPPLTCLLLLASKRVTV